MSGSRIRLIAVLVVLAVAAVMGFSGIYEVKQGEQAVVLTFGEITETKGEGLYWHLPLVQEVRRQSRMAIYTMEYGFRTSKNASATDQPQYEDVSSEAIMLTGDQNIVQVEAVYQVLVQDVQSFFYNVDNPFGTMQCAFETVLRRNLQNRTLDDALLNKQDIEAQLLPDFREMLKPYALGITIKAVQIQNISVPQEVLSAYEDVNNAKNEKTRKLDEAEKYKNQVVPNARAEAYKLVQDAEAYKARTIANAEGEVVEFNEVLARYVNSKDITRTRLLIETLESILAKAARIYMMDDDSGILKILTLDPDQPAATVAPAPQTVPVEGGN